MDPEKGGREVGRNCRIGTSSQTDRHMGKRIRLGNVDSEPQMEARLGTTGIFFVELIGRLDRELWISVDSWNRSAVEDR